MSAVCVLCIRCLCTVFVLYVYCACTVYALFVYCMSTVCVPSVCEWALYVYYVHTVFVLCVHCVCIYTVCVLCVRCMFTVFVLCVCYVLWVCYVCALCGNCVLTVLCCALWVWSSLSYTTSCRADWDALGSVAVDFLGSGRNDKSVLVNVSCSLTHKKIVAFSSMLLVTFYMLFKYLVMKIFPRSEAGRTQWSTHTNPNVWLWGMDLKEL